MRKIIKSKSFVSIITAFIILNAVGVCYSTDSDLHDIETICIEHMKKLKAEYDYQLFRFEDDNSSITISTFLSDPEIIVEARQLVWDQAYEDSKNCPNSKSEGVLLTSNEQNKSIIIVCDRIYIYDQLYNYQLNELVNKKMQIANLYISAKRNEIKSNYQEQLNNAELECERINILYKNNQIEQDRIKKVEIEDKKFADSINSQAGLLKKSQEQFAEAIELNRERKLLEEFFDSQAQINSQAFNNFLEAVPRKKPDSGNIIVKPGRFDPPRKTWKKGSRIISNYRNDSLKISKRKIQKNKKKE